MYKSTDLRYKTKEMLDRAKNGESVTIVRDGIEYTLLLSDKLPKITFSIEKLEDVERRMAAIEPIIMQLQEKAFGPQSATKESQVQYTNNEIDEVRQDLEFSCCRNAKPCKHWTWDSSTGEGYVNSLSGRKVSVL